MIDLDDALHGIGAGLQHRLLVIGQRDLDDALDATGLEVQTVPVEEFPPLTELTAYQSVVLVDVDARRFPDEHVANLSSFVRDLGRGLTVIGGDQSFALGGYRDSALEELLPVESEIEDLEREANVMIGEGKGHITPPAHDAGRQTA